MLNRYLDISTEVKEALEQGKPVVALESTIISHGMPYPQNVETAMNVEKLIRENGAVPATIAIIKGRLKAGLTAEEIDYLGRAGHAVPKASRPLPDGCGLLPLLPESTVRFRRCTCWHGKPPGKSLPACGSAASDPADLPALQSDRWLRR